MLGEAGAPAGLGEFKHLGDPLGGGRGRSTKGASVSSRVSALPAQSNIAPYAAPVHGSIRLAPDRRRFCAGQGSSPVAAVAQDMRDHLKRNLLLGIALAAVIAGVILAVTSGMPRHRHPANTRQALSGGSAHSDLQLAAQYLGISSAELRRRLRTGETMVEVANSTPGKSASGLTTALLAPRAARVRARKPSGTAEQEALKRERAQILAETVRVRGRSGPLPTAAGYLGMSVPALRARVRAGQSLAEVARAQKKSREGLIGALVSVKAQRLKTALQEHALTPAQLRAALSRLGKRVRRQIDAHLGTGPA